MNDRPNTDGFTVQIDVYSGSADSARTVAAAVRDAVEGVSYITNWLGESVDPDTGNYRFSMQTDWITPR
jgi:CYTH domain-containing protein